MTPFTTTYQHAGVTLTVTGERDADDCWVTRITAEDVSELLGDDMIEAIAKGVDAQLTQEARQEAAADAAWNAYQDARQAAYDRCPA